MSKTSPLIKLVRQRYIQRDRDKEKQIIKKHCYRCSFFAKNVWYLLYYINVLYKCITYKCITYKCITYKCITYTFITHRHTPQLSAWPDVRETADTDGGAYSPFRSILLVLTHDFIIIQLYGPACGDG